MDVCFAPQQPSLQKEPEDGFYMFIMCSTKGTNNPTRQFVIFVGFVVKKRTRVSASMAALRSNAKNVAENISEAGSF